MVQHPFRCCCFPLGRSVVYECKGRALTHSVNMGNDANVSNPLGIGVMGQMGLRMDTPKDTCEILERGMRPTGAS